MSDLSKQDYNTRYTLIQRLQDKYDEEAWNDFFDTYSRYIYTVIRRMNISHDECIDLQQEILLKLWKKLPDFKYEPSKAKFRTWLCRVIRNNTLNYITSKQSHSRKVAKASEEPVFPKDSALDAMMQKEWEIYLTNLAMERIRGKFSSNSIAVFEMSLRGAGVVEVAEALGIKENSVYKLKNRVKERLLAEVRQLRQDLE